MQTADELLASQHAEAARLAASGYRCTSRRSRSAARLDRPDWRRHMAEEHTRGFTWPPERRLEEGLRWVSLLGDRGAADYYRRVTTKDRIGPMDEAVARELRRLTREDAGPDDYRDVVEPTSGITAGEPAQQE